MSLIFSLETINIVLPDLNDFLLIAVSVATAAAVNPNGIKSLLIIFYVHFLLKAIQFSAMVIKV